MIVIEVPRQRIPQIPSAENHEMIQAFPANGTNQTLGIRILPGALRCREHFFDSQGRQAGLDFSAVNTVSVTDQESGCLGIGTSLHDVLGGPSRSRMLGDRKVQHLATAVIEHKEYEQHFKVIVDTVKKSIETICPTWLCRNVFQV